MIPILYSEKETGFATNGLGRLADAATCKVEENRNGKYELTMQYPADGIHFGDIKHSRIIYAVPADGKGAQPFRIYSITKPIKGMVTVNAEHISYQLSHIPVIPFTANNVAQALNGLYANAAETCPFTFWTDMSTTAKMTVSTPSSIRALLGGSAGTVLDVYGGEYEFDKYTVKLHKARGTDKGVTLRYGKNITDLKQEENIQSTYTGIMPYWNSEQDGQVILDEKVIHSSSASNYPFQRTRVVDLTSQFQAKPTQAQLRSAANSYIKNNNIGVPKVSMKISFVALWQTDEYASIAPLERVNLCDTVTVDFSALGVSTKAKVIKTVYNVLSERYDSIELGEARASFTKDVNESLNSINTTIDNATDEMKRSIAERETALKQAIDTATSLIQGGLGGHVIMNTNADGKPNEILIMDTEDKNTAVNVIRMNENGIGFSTQGYNGPFSTAWTIDGKFNASFITTGTLSAITIVGALFQTATQGKRIVMDSSSSIKGLDGATMYNAINLENESHQMTLDASQQMTIRTPKLAVVDKSYGTGGGEATLARTGGTQVVIGVEKDTERGSSKQDCHEVGVKDVGFESCDVYCVLPVYLDVTYGTVDSINGLIVSDTKVKTESI